VIFSHSDHAEATEAAIALWSLLAHHVPLMGPSWNLHIDRSNKIIVEVTNSQVFRDLVNLEVLDWVFLLAPGMASVDPRGGVESLADLNQLVEYFKEYNSKKKGKASQGTFFVERLVLSSTLMAAPDIASTLKDPHQRVYWDRNAHKDSSAHLNIPGAKSLQASDASEVIVFLAGWHSTSSKDTKNANILENVVGPYLAKIMESKGVPMVDKNPFTWFPTQSQSTWKLKCATVDMAAWLCKAVIDMPVRLQDAEAMRCHK
jgi:hypothetical protein